MKISYDSFLSKVDSVHKSNDKLLYGKIYMMVLSSTHSAIAESVRNTLYDPSALSEVPQKTHDYVKLLWKD